MSAQTWDFDPGIKSRRVHLLPIGDTYYRLCVISATSPRVYGHVIIPKAHVEHRTLLAFAIRSCRKAYQLLKAQ